MPHFRARRGCGGLLTRIVLVAMLAVVALVCVANRSWIEGRLLNALYDGRPQIHTGDHFTPGATAEEDGVRQTAVLVHGKPSVKVTRPTEEWSRHHKDADCDGDVCTAAATKGGFPGAGGFDIAGVLAMALVCYLVWVLLVDNEAPTWSRRGGYGRGGRGGYDY